WGGGGGSASAAGPGQLVELLLGDLPLGPGRRSSEVALVGENAFLVLPRQPIRLRRVEQRRRIERDFVRRLVLPGRLRVVAEVVGGGALTVVLARLVDRGLPERRPGEE